MNTDIEKAYNPEKYEADIYKNWEKSGYFNPDNLNLEENAPPYSIIMPPPNVTGVLHMGHSAMLAYQDILIRYHRMKGSRTLWVPGTDHAAIATQAKVESKILEEEGKTKFDLGREEFLERVRQYAQDSHDTIKNQIQKMGSSCDWSREAYTLDDIRTKTVRSVFKMMYEDGLIYQGERIVNWCPRCHSTLSDDEVEYKSSQAKLYTFKYSPDFPFSIATTRPETKLADTAVAVNPDDERYKQYIGQTFEVDFVGVPLKLKVIADKSIDPEFGTGALGVTPAHSATDWDLAEAHDLEIVKAIYEDGKIKSDYGEFSGKTVAEARELIVERIKERDLLENEEEIENNLSICYRCDTPVEPLPSLQWFIDVNKKISKFDKSIKEMCKEAVSEGVFGKEKINIVPPRFEKNYYHWIDNLRDWCISRQIWFGHRIPVWYKGDEIYVGLEDPKEEGWRQDRDTLDTWFSSGLWTFSTMAHKAEDVSIEDKKIKIDTTDYKKYHPTAVLETGYDILFFWVARMIIMTTYAVEDIPFQDVYLHGLVLDGEGKKMSKSKGNVMDPIDMIDKYGTDSTRLSLVIGSSPGADIKLSEEKVAGFRNLVNKLWNISRFILTTYEDKPIADEELTDADVWILDKFANLIKEVGRDIKKYNFSQAGEKLRDFSKADLADWYLEASKFEKGENKNYILFSILRDLLKLWHPFIPFVTEAIWSKFEDSDLIVADWPESSKYEELIKNKKSEKFDIIKDVITSIRNARSENSVEPGKKVKAFINAGDYKDFLKQNVELIKGMRTGIADLEIEESGEPKEDYIYAVTGQIGVFLIGAVDKEKEKKRIDKEIENLNGFIDSLKSKLDNEGFVNNAPKEVVEKEKERLEKARGEKRLLEDKLNNLKL